MSETTTTQAQPDVREMVMVHRVFRRTLSELPALIAAVPPGDLARAEQLAAHLRFVLKALHHHHGGEDELLWPLLEQRCPEQATLVADMQGQHDAVAGGLRRTSELLETWAGSAEPADGAALSDAIAALHVELAVHLDAEEQRVLPLVPDHLSVTEWAALREHAMSRMDEQENPRFLGLMIESMPDDERAEFFAHMPPPIADGWAHGGRPAFEAYITGIRGQ